MSSATLRGSSPTGTVRTTRLVRVAITDTESAPGLTVQTKRPSNDVVIGLEDGGVLKEAPNAGDTAPSAATTAKTVEPTTLRRTALPPSTLGLRDRPCQDFPGRSRTMT